MTSPRKRLLAVLSGRQPDRVPWMADLGCWFSRLGAAGKLPRPYMATGGIFQLHRDLEVGFYLPGCMPFSVDFEDVKLVERIGEGRTSTEVVTPVGSIRQVSVEQQGACTPAMAERFIKSVADLRVLRFWYEHASYRPQYEAARDLIAQIGEAGVAVSCMPCSPLVQLASALAGAAMLNRLSEEAPGELEETLSLVGHKADEAAAMAVGSPAECLIFREESGVDPIDARTYQRFGARWHARWAERIREAGKRSLLRVHGALAGLVAEAAVTGVDAVESVGPQTFQCPPADGAILWGGLPPACFTDAAGDREFDDLVLRAIDIARSSHRYVLGVAGEVPPAARLDRVKRVGELVESRGSYRSAG